jgi:TetR/AcrR family transcriptional regulator, transcriptional repressor for nem operon
MAWKETHKQESRQRILMAAGKLFGQKGFNQVGIDEVMLTAGLTRGAFYAHFTSKYELYEQAIIFAGTRAAQHFGGISGNNTELFDNYLSQDHLVSNDVRCLLPCLVSDVAHDDERVRKTYTKILKGFTQHLKTHAQEDVTEDTLLLQTVLLIGGMALARSVNDDALAQKILSVSKKAAKAAIEQ